MNFIKQNTFVIRLFKYLRGKFARRERRPYMCVTCGLPYTGDGKGKPVDD